MVLIANCQDYATYRCYIRRANNDKKCAGCGENIPEPDAGGKKDGKN